MPQPGEVLIVLGAGLLLGSLNGILVGLLDIWRFERYRPATPAPRKDKRFRIIVEVAGYWLALALLNGLLIGMLSEPVFGLIMGAVLGPVFGVLFGIHGGWRNMSNDVRTVEALDWSLTGLRRSAVRGAAAAKSGSRAGSARR